MPRVRTVACLGGVSPERDVPEEQIGEYTRTTDNVTWVDVEDPGVGPFDGASPLHVSEVDIFIGRNYAVIGVRVS